MHSWLIRRATYSSDLPTARRTIRSVQRSWYIVRLGGAVATVGVCGRMYVAPVGAGAKTSAAAKPAAAAQQINSTRTAVAIGRSDQNEG
jgi:hypothetical protein